MSRWNLNLLFLDLCHLLILTRYELTVNSMAFYLLFWQINKFKTCHCVVKQYINYKYILFIQLLGIVIDQTRVFLHQFEE